MPRKVICIDATPIPIFLGAGEDIPEFTFPNGFIQEGTTYAVERSVLLRNNTTGYILLGTPILADGYPTSWHSSRFRDISSQADRRVEMATAGKKFSIHQGRKFSLPLL